MFAVEFETDITSRYIELQEYERFKDRHVKVIILAEEDNKSFSAEATKKLEEFFIKRKEMKKVDTSFDIDSICNEVNDSDLF